MQDKYHYSDGTILEYWDRAKTLHRERAPAVEHHNGYKCWYLNGKHHREDGPAIECPSGSKCWYLNGRHHREDGPAIEWANGDKGWFLKGVRYTEEEYNRIVPIDLDFII